MPPDEDCSDEELMCQLAAGAQEALGPLYSRYARLIFHLAARTLDRPAAEEIVQDVFLVVWRQAATFDPTRGLFRPWVLQITHFRILNELRRRSRQPQLELDPDGLHLASLPDDSPEPAEEDVRRLLRELEKKYLRREQSALTKAIRQAEEAGQNEEVSRLMQRAQEIGKRIVELGR